MTKWRTIWYQNLNVLLYNRNRKSYSTVTNFYLLQFQYLDAAFNPIFNINWNKTLLPTRLLFVVFDKAHTCKLQINTTHKSYYEYLDCLTMFISRTCWKTPSLSRCFCFSQGCSPILALQILNKKHILTCRHALQLFLNVQEILKYIKLQ